MKSFLKTTLVIYLSLALGIGFNIFFLSRLQEPVDNVLGGTLFAALILLYFFIPLIIVMASIVHFLLVRPLEKALHKALKN